MPDKELEFLDARHEVFSKGEASWKREERRLFGGDAAISELAKWKEETAAHYEIRKNEASWLNFPKIHASTLAGHLGRVAPMPNFGGLGQEVRSRKESRGQPSLAELVYYNVDGIGSDGSQWHPWMNGIQERAIATGHRWALVEMPEVADAKNSNGTAGSNGKQLTRADELNGHRPYLVEFSPLQVTCWEVSHGRLDWAVVRLRVRPQGETAWAALPTEPGYYLFVRENYAGLGDAYAGGGWWMFDSDKALLSTGDWSRTKGQISLVPLIAESSQGTTEWPAMSRSLTMELGQIAVSLMNRIAERNFDASDAAKSVKYFLGADKDGFNLAVEFHEKNALLVPIIGAMTPDGKYTVPTIYDGSSGAVAAEVFTTIINSTIAEAHEIMVRQISSAEDASGISRDKGFAEATSPLLAGLAQRREAFENAVIYFLELRAGNQNPSGFVTWRTEFELAPVLTKIERTIARLQSISVRSPTLEAELLRRAAEDDGLWPAKPEDQAKATEELLASARAASAKIKGEAMLALVNAGADLETASREAGFSEETVTALISGGSNNNGSDDDDRSADGTPESNGTVPFLAEEVGSL